eukprot:scaffold7667_cov161-Amphora_coffeaeformis.AAC.4
MGCTPSKSYREQQDEAAKEELKQYLASKGVDHSKWRAVNPEEKDAVRTGSGGLGTSVVGVTVAF